MGSWNGYEGNSIFNNDCHLLFQTGTIGKNYTFGAKEKDDKDAEHSADPKKSYVKGASINFPSQFLVRINPVNAKITPDMIKLIDSKGNDLNKLVKVVDVEKYDNLLVVQTFSKSRQLAGARLGLAMGNAALIADLNRVKFSLNPYNINRLTLKAGQAALEDVAYFDKTRAAIVDTRAWTKQQLESRGFAVLDSRSNFLFASTGRKDGTTLYKELKKNGILVRHFDAPRIQNWLRITIGTSEQMKIFVNTLDKIMEE